MGYEWDEAKRKSNLAKHGMDFIDGEDLFDGRPIITRSSARYNEERFATTGILNGRLFTLIWVTRGDIVRMISLRRAWDVEEREYRAVHDG